MNIIQPELPGTETECRCNAACQTKGINTKRDKLINEIFFTTDTMDCMNNVSQEHYSIECKKLYTLVEEFVLTNPDNEDVRHIMFALKRKYTSQLREAMILLYGALK